MSFEDHMIDDGFNDPEDYMDYLEGKADDYLDSLYSCSEDEEEDEEEKIKTDIFYHDILATPILHAKGISDIQFTIEIKVDSSNKVFAIIHVAGVYVDSGTPYEGIINPGYFAEETDRELLSLAIDDVVLRVAENKVRLSSNDEWHTVSKKKAVWTYILSNTNTFHLSGAPIDGYLDYPWIRDPHSRYSTVITEEDQKNSFKDNKRVVYSLDKKLLLDGEAPFPPQKGYFPRLFDRDAPILRSLSAYIIEQGTEYICDDAFRRFEELVDISIPDSVLCIGYGAFADCSNLPEIRIPKSVVSIGAQAFQSCYSLKIINFDIAEDSNKLLTTILPGTFSYCGVTEIQLPLYVESIGWNAFSHCGKLLSVIMSNSVKSIGRYAFSECVSLKTIVLSDSLEFIEKFAFKNCESLHSVEFPDSVKTIGENAFYGCSSLESIKMSNPDIAIDKTAFCGCKSLKRVLIPKGMRESFSRIFGEIVIEIDDQE